MRFKESNHNGGGLIDKSLMEEIMKMKTDTLLIEYLSECRWRVVEMEDERGYSLL